MELEEESIHFHLCRKREELRSIHSFLQHPMEVQYIAVTKKEGEQR